MAESPDRYQTNVDLLGRLNADAAADRDAARGQFYEFYAPIIAGFARRMGVSPQDVNDLVHDVLAGFYASRFVYDPSRGRFRGFLKTCTWRLLRDKSKARRVKIDGRPIDEHDDAAVQIEQVWNDVWEQEKLQRALTRVRLRYQARPERAATFRAFEMLVILERPAQEVAEKLGLSIDSVHAAKSRVGRAVRAEYDALDGEVG